MKKQLNFKLPSDNGLQRFANVAAIVGMVFTILFSIAAYRLGQTANKLALKSIQLTESDTKQDSLLFKLCELVDIQSKQLTEIASETDLLRVQNSITVKHFELDENETKKEQKALVNRVAKVLKKLGDMDIEDEISIAILKESTQDRTMYIYEINEILLSETENVYILSSSILNAEWIGMIKKCESTAVALGKITANDDLKYEQESKKIFDNFVDELFNFKQTISKHVPYVPKRSSVRGM